MPGVTFEARIVIAGISLSGERRDTQPAHLAAEVPLPAAKTGSLSTRTDNTSGTLTMDAGHGFTTAATIDLYWIGGSRLGVLLGTVSVNSCPFSGGTGDNLPTQGTAITASIPTTIDLDWVGSKTRAMAATSDKRWGLTLLDGTTIRQSMTRGARELYAWMTGDPTLPIDGFTISSVRASNADSAASAYFQFGVLHSG